MAINVSIQYTCHGSGIIVFAANETIILYIWWKVCTDSLL